MPGPTDRQWGTLVQACSLAICTATLPPTSQPGVCAQLLSLPDGPRAWPLKALSLLTQGQKGRQQQNPRPQHPTPGSARREIQNREADQQTPLKEEDMGQAQWHSGESCRLQRVPALTPAASAALPVQQLVTNPGEKVVAHHPHLQGCRKKNWQWHHPR